MRRAVSSLMLFLIIVNSLALYGNPRNMKGKHINSVIAINEVFGNRQKVTAGAIEYDHDISNSKLSKSVFTIDGRTITNVYANTAASKAAHGINGKYVIIEFSQSDIGATKAFPGMNTIIATLENQGAKISRAKWNARTSEPEKAANVKRMIDENTNIKYVVFEKGTVSPEGKPGRMEHMSTWKVAL